MKKILLLLVAVTSIISCSKDDDSVQELSLEQQLVGNWKLEKQLNMSNNEYYESTCFKDNYSLNFTSTEITIETYCKYSVVIVEEVKTLNYSSSVIDYTDDPNVKVLRLFSQNGGYNGGMLQKRYFIRSISETNLQIESFYVSDEFLTQGTANLDNNEKRILFFSKQ